MEELLPLAHHSQVAIVHNGNFKHQALLMYSSEFLDVHLNAAITGHYPHRCIGYAHFDTHSSGEGKTHCTEAARGNMAIEAGPYVVACRPHLVLSHIGDNNGLAMCFCTNSVQDASGIRMLLIAFDARTALAIHGLPTTYFAEPCLVIAWLDCLDKGRQGMASTFLVRLRVGEILMDAKGVSRLYGGRVRGRDVAVLVAAALFAMLIIASISQPFRLFWHLVWEQLRGLL